MVVEAPKAPLDQKTIITDAIFSSDSFKSDCSQITELSRSLKYHPYPIGEYSKGKIGLVYFGEQPPVQKKILSVFNDAAETSGFKTESVNGILGVLGKNLSPKHYKDKVQELSEKCDVLVVSDPEIVDLVKEVVTVPIVLACDSDNESYQGVLSDVSTIVGNFLETREPTLSVLGNLRSTPRLQRIIQGLSEYPRFNLKISGLNKLLPDSKEIAAIEDKGLEVHRFGGIGDLGADGKTIYLSRYPRPLISSELPAIKAQWESICKINLTGFKEHTSQFPDTKVLYPALEPEDVMPKGLHFQHNPSFTKQGTPNLVVAAYMLKLALSPQTQAQQ